ncbi:MAG: hypothetical protein KR126chlam6_01076, partial [Candidatus Anoxychlamydiales bacterium]|nr:hypothetical protein [Candidatus Anoxychlamydiales bacterium]
TSNSIYGTTATDAVGEETIPLTNGNFVTQTTTWNDGAVLQVGAATWGDGASGTTGAVSVSNSFIGDSNFDFLTFGIGTVALSNGNYIVQSDFYPDLSSKGTVSFGDGSTGTFGVVDSTNSLIGTTASDTIGSGGITLLAEGNYLISSPLYDDGGNANAGAVTLGDGTNGTLGSITTDNSVIGAKPNAGLGTIAYETVFQKAYMQFANDNTSGGTSGRVIVMQLPVTPTPTPTPTPAAPGFSFNDKVLISNTTFAARSELFRMVSPFGEYTNFTDFLNNYIAFDLFETFPDFEIVKIDETCVLKNLKQEKLDTILRYHIRQRPLIYYLDIPKTSLK